MHDSRFRRLVFIIIAAAVVLRLGFLVFGDVLPVMWDARRYAAAALGLISYVDTEGAGDFATERDDRYRFKYYYDKYLDGEKIDWLAYTPHTLTQAREELFFSGPLYPLFLSVIIYASPAADFTVVRLFGILFDILALWLLIAIGKRLVGRRAALVAGAIYAVYFPFVLTSTMLLLETTTSLLILLTIYLLLRAAESNRTRPLILAGIATGALILNKPTAMLLAIPILIGYYLYTRSEWHTSVFINRAVKFIIPVAVIFVGWTAVASAHYGQFTLRDPQYAEANLRQSTSALFEGYDLDKVEEGFWTRSVAEDILSDLPAFGGLIIKKFDRLFRRPYNDFRRSFIIPYGANEFIHLALVVFGLAGLLVMLRLDLGKAAWPFLIIGYYLGIHLIFHSISRYNFQAMPMVMLSFGFFVTIVARAWSPESRNRAGRLLLALLVIMAGWVIDIRWLNALFNTGLTESLVWAGIAVKALLFLMGLRILFGGLRRSYTVGKWLIPAAVTLIVGVTGASNTIARNEWAEFECRLDSTQMKAGTRLFISDLAPLAKGEMLAVVADVNSGAGRSNTFTMSIGDSQKQLVGGQPPLSDLFYPKPTYKFYAEFIPMGIEEFRQYAIIPVGEDFVRAHLARDGYFDINLAINENFEEPNNYISVWGKFDTGEDTRYIPGWRFTSIERFVHENDPRIRYPVNYLSDSTISYYIPRTGGPIAPEQDLSPSPGLQTGRYNIFLMHFKPDGEVLIY